MFALLLSIITFTLTSTTDGTYDYEGDEPVGMECTYDHTATSGSKGQMTAGNSTTLTITGWKGYTIKNITLSMKSNKSVGAGKLEVTIDGKPVWTISDSKFSSKNWHGAFSQAFVPIEHTFSPEVVCSQGDLSIYIEASENSLYVESYTIEYEVPLPHPYTLSCRVTDDMVLPITETAVGAGVILPPAPNMSGWYFVGWVSNIYTPTTSVPVVIYHVGERYPLTDDEILYALYQDVPITPPVEKDYNVCQTTTYESGEYALCTRPLNGTSYMVYDLPKNYQWPAYSTTKVTFDVTKGVYTMDSRDISDNAIYYFTFNTTDSTVTIQQSTYQYITYGSTYGIIKSGRDPWNYRVLKDSTIILYIKAGGNGDTYPTICKYYGADAFRTEKLTTEQMEGNGLLLFPNVDIPEEEPIVITYKTFATKSTDPIPSPVEDIEMDDNSEVVYYNLLGQKVPKEALSNGVYIRRVGKHVEKIYYYE